MRHAGILWLSPAVCGAQTLAQGAETQQEMFLGRFKLNLLLEKHRELGTRGSGDQGKKTLDQSSFIGRAEFGKVDSQQIRRHELP